MSSPSKLREKYPQMYDEYKESLGHTPVHLAPPSPDRADRAVRHLSPQPPARSLTPLSRTSSPQPPPRTTSIPHHNSYTSEHASIPKPPPPPKVKIAVPKKQIIFRTGPRVLLAPNPNIQRLREMFESKDSL